jgi:hypothetical protein
MSWVKQDDQYFRNKKFLRLGRPSDQRVKDARLLHMCGNCFIAANETDGVITETDLTYVAFDAGVDEAVAKDLVSIGAWHEPGHDCDDCPSVNEGFFVHGYLERNPTAAEAAERRAERAEAGRKGGQRSGQVRRSKAEAKAKAKGEATASPNGKQQLKPELKQKGTPSPSPSPSSTPTHVGTNTQSSSGQQSDDDVSEVIDLLARRNLERENADRRANGKHDAVVPMNRPERVEGWLVKDRLRWREVYGDRIANYLAANPDADAHEVAAWIAPELFTAEAS